MIYTVSTDEQQSITLGETDEIRSILQNVYLILTTKQNTVPMYREFGMPMNYVDRPRLVAETMAIAEIREAIKRFEPRVSVVDVFFGKGERGDVLSVKVEVKK